MMSLISRRMRLSVFRAQFFFSQQFSVLHNPQNIAPHFACIANKHCFWHTQQKCLCFFVTLFSQVRLLKTTFLVLDKISMRSSIFPTCKQCVTKRNKSNALMKKTMTFPQDVDVFARISNTLQLQKVEHVDESVNKTKITRGRFTCFSCKRKRTRVEFRNVSCCRQDKTDSVWIQLNVMSIRHSRTVQVDVCQKSEQRA